jgi:enoyl-CoA hydratase/carnithine racemase
MDQVRTQTDGGVLAIELNRPDKKNAITAAMYGALADAIAAAEGDAGVRAMLVAGAGGAFCAGNDLEDFLRNPPRGEASEVFRFLGAISTAEKPIVAAVAGAAVGIGTTMLLHCDLVYAADNTRFSLPFVNLGLCPEAASSLLVPALAGYQRAAELLLLGEPFGVDVAREIGLVNKVVPVEQLLETARFAARKLVERPASAVRATKRLMRRSRAALVREAMREEGEVFVRMLGEPAAKEAFEAFLGKRKPDFSRIA